MYRIAMMPVGNGWIVEITFEGRVEIKHVFTNILDLFKFLNKTIPILEKGYYETLKMWCGKGYYRSYKKVDILKELQKRG